MIGDECHAVRIGFASPYRLKNDEHHEKLLLNPNDLQRDQRCVVNVYRSGEGRR
jgi:hypothetical protein